MSFGNLIRRGWWPALMASVWLVSWGMAQEYGGRPQVSPYGGYRTAGQPQSSPGRQPTYPHAQPPYRTAQRAPASPNRPRDLLFAARPNEHPLMPAVRWARTGLHNVQQIQDYSAVMVKRERVEGKLGEEQFLFLKVRHRPLSVYIYFLRPDHLRGQETIWIEGQNEGKMLAHGTGIKSVFGTVRLDPTGPIAMQGNRYPITEIGILNLTRRLLEVAEQDTRYGECEVKFLPGAKVNQRSCTCIEVRHPVPRRNFRFHIARIFVDDELNLPIRYESYDWPTRPGEPPPLIEQYTYLDLKLNNGFTDADFDIRNPQYGFKSLGFTRR